MAPGVRIPAPALSLGFSVVQARPIDKIVTWVYSENLGKRSCGLAPSQAHVTILFIVLASWVDGGLLARPQAQNNSTQHKALFGCDGSILQGDLFCCEMAVSFLYYRNQTGPK